MELRRYTAKDSAPEQLQEARLISGSGIEGDYHQNVSLLTKAAALWMESLTIPGLCFEKLKVNILLDGSFSHGSQLSFADAILRVCAKQKYCFPACAYRQDVPACPLAGGMFFADLLRGGVVHVEDLGAVATAPLEMSANLSRSLD